MTDLQVIDIEGKLEISTVLRTIMSSVQTLRALTWRQSGLPADTTLISTLPQTSFPDLSNITIDGAYAILLLERFITPKLTVLNLDDMGFRNTASAGYSYIRSPQFIRDHAHLQCFTLKVGFSSALVPFLQAQANLEELWLPNASDLAAVLNSDDPSESHLPICRSLRWVGVKFYRTNADHPFLCAILDISLSRDPPFMVYCPAVETEQALVHLAEKYRGILHDSKLRKVI